MTQTAPNVFEKGFSKNDIKEEIDIPPEILELQECIVCVTQNLETYDIYNTYTISGITLNTFLSKFIITENLITENLPLQICKRCLHLVNVLEQAQMEYMRAKADFDSIISKNPLLCMPRPIKEESVESETYRVYSHNKNDSQSTMKRPRLAMKTDEASLKRDNTGNESPMVVMTETESEEFHNENENPDVRATYSDVTSTSTGREGQGNQCDRLRVSQVGSALDSDDEEDEAVVFVGMPRTTYLNMDTPTDPEETPSQAQPTKTEPDSFYNFQWLPLPSPPIPPESRRLKFTAPHIGPTISYTEPIDLFKHIWDDIIVNIAAETNKYATQLADRKSQLPSSRIRNWKDTTPEELYVFFGLILAMGVVTKSRLIDYWGTSDDIFATPGFGANMTLRRFQILSTCLQLSDSQMPQNLNKQKAELLKINPMLTQLNKKFQSMYDIGQNLVIEEYILGNAWLHIPNTPKGLKAYEVCEPQTGYMWRFRLQHHEAFIEYPPTLVMKMLEGLEHKGHTVWLGDTFNSPALARKLKTLGFDCAGPLRTNRQYVPIEIKSLEKSQMALNKIVGVTSGDMDLMVWRDQNRVATISTYHGNLVTTRRGKDKPTVIRDYKIILGSLDKKDQLLSLYPSENRRNYQWHEKLFRRLIHVSVLNSYVIYTHQHKGCTYRDFSKDLIKALLNEGPRPNIEFSLDVRSHYLQEYPKGKTTSKGRLRRTCRVCRRLSTFFCAGCNKSTCLNCFRQLHM